MTRRALGRLDARLTSRLRRLPTNAVSRLLLPLLAHSGDSLILIPLLVLLWSLSRFWLGSIAIPLAIGYLASVVLTTVLKYAVRRRRPPGEWGAMYRRTDPYSFPSGHAARTVALSLIVAASGHPLAGLLLLAWSAAVGLARIVLGVHYVFDVVAGWLLGLAIGAAVGLWKLAGFPW